MTTSPPESAFWLALAYASGLRLARAKAIVNTWRLEGGQSLSALFDLPPGKMAAEAGLSAEEAGRVTAAARRISDQAAWLARLEGAGVQLVTRADRCYPRTLVRSLPPAMQPLLLFCRGDVGMLSQPSAAVIGARDPDQEAVGFARELAALLTEEGLVVVGGLNRGVGQAAFDGALSAEEGQTVVVLPMGINAFNPSQEAATAVKQGRALLVSPYHPEAKFNEAQSLARNKLIVGLAQAVFVAEADQAGMVWETANEALRLGKVVYVRDVDAEAEPVAAGNRALIEAGALPIAGVSHIMDAVETVVERALRLAEESAPSPDAPSLPEDEDEVETPFDPQAALELLSQGGRVPEALARRLTGRSSTPQSE